MDAPSQFSLVYASRSRIPFHVGEGEAASPDILALQRDALENNRRLKVRGLLVASCGHFLHWLHGDESAVRARMAGIAADPRHEAVTVLHEGVGGTELTEWAMTLVGKPASEAAVQAEFQKLFARPLPPSTTPGGLVLRVLKPRAPASKPRRRQLVVFGQTSLWPAALLATLSDRAKAGISRTRLVGNDRMEREAILEYLDLEDPELGPLRIINVSGSAMGLPWLAGAADNVAAAVLMYSVSGADGVHDFTEHAHRHLALGGRHTPTLCLFGRTASRLGDQVQDWFAAHGREVGTAVISLADTSRVWASIGEMLNVVAETGTVSTSWKPTTIDPTGTTRDSAGAPTPELLHFSFTELSAGSTPTAAPRSDVVVPGQSDATASGPAVAAAPALAAGPAMAAAPVSAPAPVPAPATAAAPAVAAARAKGAAPAKAAPVTAAAPLPAAASSAAAAPVASTAPAPALPPAEPLPPRRALGAAGREWLADLLELQSVAGVAAQDGPAGAATLMLAQAVRHFAGTRSELENTLHAILRDEVAVHGHIPTEVDADGSPIGAMVLTRFTDRIMVSIATTDAPPAVVCLFFNPGWMNEALTMNALRSALAMIPTPLFVASPDPFPAPDSTTA